MEKTLRGLEVLSNQLKEKSEQLNQTIAMFNEKLGSLNLGIETWLTSDPLVKGEPLDTSTTTVACRSSKVIVLGYCRVAERWQLAFKHAVVNDFVDDGFEWTEVTDSSPAVALLQASRVLRIKAMGKIESLLVKIQTEASVLLSGIEAAEGAAAKL